MSDTSAMKSQETVESWGVGRTVVLPATLLFGAMFNLTLVVAGLKEFMIEDLGGSIADATLFFSVETLAYIIFAPIWGLLSDRFGTIDRARSTRSWSVGA